MKCTHCGSNIPDPHQSKAAKAKWKKTTTKQRSDELRRVALVRWGKTNKKAE